MTARDKFNGIQADFWDCKDAEHLTHLDPISALEDLVDSHREPGTPTEEVIREMGEISVEAYRRAVITEEMIRDTTDGVLDYARESLDSDMLRDPEDERPMFSADVLASYRPVFETAVRALAARAVVWQCEIATSVELTPAEVIEILLTERPEWFGAEPAPAPAAAPPEGA